MLFNRTQPNKPNDSLQQLLEYSRKLVVDAEKNEVNGLFTGEADLREYAEIVSNVNKAIHIMNQKNEALTLRLTMLNQVMNIGVWESNIVAGDALDRNNNVSFSDEFRRMLGYANAEDYPNEFASWAKSVNPEDRPQLVQAITENVNNPREAAPYNLISRMILKSGEVRWFRCLGQVVRNSEGVPVG